MKQMKNEKDLKLYDEAFQLKNEIDLRELLNGILRRKKIFLIGFAFFFSMSGVRTLYNRSFNPIYRGSFSLMITDPLADQKDNRSADISDTFENLALNTNKGQDIQTLIEFLQSPYLIGDIAKKYNVTTKKLRKRILLGTIGTGNKTAKGIINVFVSGSSKEETKSLLEDLSRKYLNASLEQRQQRLSDGLNFLNNQAPELQRKTSLLQLELANFREKNNLLDPIAEGQAVKVRLIETQAQLLNLESNKKRLTDLKKQIEKGNFRALKFEEEITSNSIEGKTFSGQGLTFSGDDQGLLTELIAAESQLSKALTRYTSDSLVVKNLEEKLAQIKPLLKKNQLEAVDAALASTQVVLDLTEKNLKTLNEEFLKQPQLIKEYEDVIQRLTISQQNLAGLVSAREKFQLEIAQGSYPWKVISPPFVDPYPAEPSLKDGITTGIIFGLLFGAALAFLRDRLDHVYHSSDELGELRRPILGYIPFVDIFKDVREEKENIISKLAEFENTKELDEEAKKKRSFQRFFYQEAFRNLSTSIRFLNTEKSNKKVFAITSSMPTEGKSLVSILLSKTVEEMGQKIVLVDSDLRKPQVHTRLGLDNILGLSNYLADPTVKADQILQKVPDHNSWRVITSGRVAPDPTRLLNSSRMDELIKEIQDVFEPDLILFDTPPVLGLADSSLTSKHCDGMFLIVSLNKVDRTLPNQALQKLKMSGTEVLGIIANESIKTKSRSSNGYGYGKSGYGYGGYNEYTYAAYYDESETKPENSTNEANKIKDSDLKETNLITLFREKYKSSLSKLKDKMSIILEWLDK